jgi:tetratricopeptide (TPR) repeat protein
MVSQNEGPWRPKNPGNPHSGGLTPEDLAIADSALSQEDMAQLRQAVELGRTGNIKGAAEVSRVAIRTSKANGSINEASVILSFLPALLPGAEPDEALKLAHRAVAIAAGRPHCEHLTSKAHFFAMQAQLRADLKPAAMEEAEACVAAGKASKIHCKWLATAWRYYGMLLGLSGRMPEALIAMSNAIELAKCKPADDPLALARAYDAMGRSLLEMKKPEAAAASLRKALLEFANKGAINSPESIKTQALLSQIENG